jgi:hypothetical protein
LRRASSQSKEQSKDRSRNKAKSKVLKPNQGFTPNRLSVSNKVLFEAS